MSLNIQTNAAMPQNQMAFKARNLKITNGIIPNKADRRELVSTFITIPLAVKITGFISSHPRLSVFINKLAHKRCNTNTLLETTKK